MRSQADGPSSAVGAAADARALVDARGRGALDTVVAGARAWQVSFFVTALGLWIGATAFVSAGVLPILFINLEPSEAGKIAALIFPTYFRAGLAAGLLASAGAFVLARTGGRRWQAAFALVAIMTIAQGWSALVIHPEMATIRGVADQVERFQQLHTLSVRLNGFVLASGMLLLAATGFLLSVRRGRT